MADRNPPARPGSEAPSLPARPTIYDVAERAGVSKSLVSLVLRDAPHVSDARRLAVLNAIEELGYRPSRAASALASQRTRSVGVLIDDFHNPWFVELLGGLRSVLDPAGYTVSVADFQLEAASGRNPVDGFIAQHVDALVLAAEPEEGLLRDVSVPVVVAGVRELGSGALPHADVVAGDDELGGELATRHLLDLGHRAIAHISGRSGPAAHRRRGYERTMRGAGLASRVVGADRTTTEAEGYAAAHELFAEHPEITALVASNDLMAVGTFAALRERGLSVPADVAVVGYDNSPLAAYRYLALTSVDPHSREIGAETARTLLSRLDDPGAPRRHALIEPSLVVRESTAPRG
ncbi:LacI family DNA-binding transcriptional regulator [Sinomonas sp. JGH33]|uniref:LacI family DNA-binding transcriptional regulator n=1 Tax=Sinomonas terricola TaxID=3110330 RepID=A0ABU5T389_9MICC|nr:LacI family DNA-binding transcriptional regulator [Sinomonas sp. JGH33]MEA5454120.1 LacI family DNA-binding transcriptional regulator [Sinomonas sp. JGH33]